tara:strand:+ start:893 stop:1483 length:591 start_codon:yes stop_codon:yes gene_type:complete
MKELNQWILCNGKTPVAPTGGLINPHDPKHHMSYVDTVTASGLMKLGVGFVFTSSDPYWFLDIDHCLIDGKWSPIAQSLMEAFPGACMEVSSGGDGIHIFGKGEVPEHSSKNKEHGIEFYDTGRFVLVNSDLSHGDYNSEHPEMVQWLVNSYFQPKIGQSVEWRNSPVPEWNGIEDDAMLITKMRGSKSARQVFGG